MNDPVVCRERLEAHVEADSPFAIEMLACMHQQGRLGLAKDSREAARALPARREAGQAARERAPRLAETRGLPRRAPRPGGRARGFFECGETGRRVRPISGRPIIARRRRRAAGHRALGGGGGPGSRAAAIERSGAIHDRGEGVPRNLATAAIWYSRGGGPRRRNRGGAPEELRAETRDIFKGMRFV